ncbi:ATP-binding protein [Spongiactinospora sp. TRM90649]|uniref:ATP-binding protein n=1 Tax=Spongiactinospora sp. TRM90649 TaxID=3031114 RepID=UPI0023F6FCC1|nr:ATP-binding protein [Spongiactinospora sp. TRM90649]MDF5756111.1 ATP-binding protein [Spongiactinospora sp. TRM90649]
MAAYREPKPSTIAVVTLPGTARAVTVVRHWAALVLETDGWTEVDDTLLVVTELAANAVRHTASGRPGGRMEVVLIGEADGLVRVEVADEGAATIPTVGRADWDGLGGRGLRLVSTLAAAWGARLAGRGRTVWALMRLPPAEPVARPADDPCGEHAESH